MYYNLAYTEIFDVKRLFIIMLLFTLDPLDKKKKISIERRRGDSHKAFAFTLAFRENSFSPHFYPCILVIAIYFFKFVSIPALLTFITFTAECLH